MSERQMQIFHHLADRVMGTYPRLAFEIDPIDPVMYVYREQVWIDSGRPMLRVELDGHLLWRVLYAWQHAGAVDWRVGPELLDECLLKLGIYLDGG